MIGLDILSLMLSKTHEDMVILLGAWSIMRCIHTADWAA